MNGPPFAADDRPAGEEHEVAPRRLMRGMTVVLMLVFVAVVIASLIPMLSASKSTGGSMPGMSTPQTSPAGTSPPRGVMPGMSMPSGPSASPGR